MTYPPMNVDRSCGIYRIVNRRNGKFYVGSTKSADKRKREHFTRLDRQIHKNPILQNAWKAEDDKSVFEFHMFICCNVDDLKKIEQGCIDNMKPAYNASPRADRPTPFEFWPKEKQDSQRKLCKELFSGENNPSCLMTENALKERAAKGTETRRSRGTDVSGTQKAMLTRKEKGINKLIGQKAAAARIANGTETTRFVKGVETRKNNGSYLTGAAKAAATRKEKGIDARVVLRNAKIRKEKGTDFFTSRNPSTTMTKEQLYLRRRKSGDTLRWNKLKVALEMMVCWGS